LAEDGQPEVNAFTTPLGGDFPLLEIAQVVSVLGSIGTVSGVAIEVSHGAVRQSVTLGEETRNRWMRFAKLLPREPLLAGELLADHGDGTATIEMFGGGERRVRGTGTVGSNYWIRGGRIEGVAPALPAYDVDV
jgi:hypothetical protein